MIRKFLIACSLSLSVVHNIAFANVSIESTNRLHNHKYVYEFPKIISSDDDIRLTYNLLKTAYLHGNYIRINDLVKNKHVKFDVHSDKLMQELNMFAVRAIAEEQPELAMNIANSYNPRNNTHIISLGIITKALISQGYVKEAEEIVREIAKNDQRNENANKALGSIAKRAAYTPGAEHIAFDIEKSRPNINEKIREDIEKRKSTYDKNIWEAKILFMKKSRADREEEIVKIIKLYNPETKDGVRKLTILAKDALRARKFEIAKNIIAKIESAKPMEARELGSIAKSAIYIQGGIPIALDIAKNLGDDDYSRQIKALVTKISEEHLQD